MTRQWLKWSFLFALVVGVLTLERSASWLVGLSTGLSAPAADPAPRDGGNAALRNQVHDVRGKLNKPVGDFDGFDAGTHLRDALEFLADRHGVPITIDDGMFRVANPDLDLGNTPIRLPKMRGVPLSTVLRMLLSQAASNGTVASYRVQPGYIEITPMVRLRPEMWSSEGIDPTLLLHYVPVVDVEFDKRPLSDAFAELSDLTGVNIVVDGRSGDPARTPITARLLNAPLDNAVWVLANMANLTVLPMGNVLYVTTRENARQLEKEHLQRRNGSPPA